MPPSPANIARTLHRPTLQYAQVVHRITRETAEAILLMRADQAGRSAAQGIHLVRHSDKMGPGGVVVSVYANEKCFHYPVRDCVTWCMRPDLLYAS